MRLKEEKDAVDEVLKQLTPLKSMEDAASLRTYLGGLKLIEQVCRACSMLTT